MWTRRKQQVAYLALGALVVGLLIGGGSWLLFKNPFELLPGVLLGVVLGTSIYLLIFGVNSLEEYGKKLFQPEKPPPATTEAPAPEPTPAEKPLQSPGPIKSKRGRKPATLKERVRVVMGWLAVQGSVSQEDYCRKVGIDPSTLRDYCNNAEVIAEINSRELDAN